jgi:hypothetical protein
VPTRKCENRHFRAVQIVNKAICDGVDGDVFRVLCCISIVVSVLEVLASFLVGRKVTRNVTSGSTKLNLSGIVCLNGCDLA